MKPLTPGALFKSYCALKNEDQLAFLQLVGQVSTAEVPLVLYSTLRVTEQARVTEVLFEPMFQFVLPSLIHEAIRLAKERPELSEHERAVSLHALVAGVRKQYEQEISDEAMATFKDKRERKPDPATIKRAVEICDLRRQDPKKWSLERLARKFDVSRQYIQRTIREEARWRLLAKQGGN